jgi:hypothetical protein
MSRDCFTDLLVPGAGGFLNSPPWSAVGFSEVTRKQDSTREESELILVTSLSVVHRVAFVCLSAPAPSLSIPILTQLCWRRPVDGAVGIISSCRLCSNAAFSILSESLPIDSCCTFTARGFVCTRLMPSSPPPPVLLLPVAWYLPLITFIGASGCTLATAALSLHFPLPSHRPSLHSNMAPHPTNRFALFAEGNENSPPNISQGFNIARIPFENQVADDTIPWQQVKKRSAVEPQQPLPKIKTLVIRDQNRPVSVRRPPSETKPRASSVTANTPTTATGSDKSYDPHENWCGVCNQKFHTKVALQSHMKQTENHQHYCNLCARVFKDRNGLKNHVDNSLGHDVFCNLCLSAFKDQWGLKNHFENNYHVGHEFACLTCLLGFKSHQDMVKHLQTAKKHIWCETCHRPFRNQDERDAHWKKTAGEGRLLQHFEYISSCLQLIQHTSTAWNPAVALMDPMLLHFGRITS